MNIKLQYVKYMPKELEPGVLYVSKEFNTAAHLCLCGCGSKVRTPLTPTEWSLTVSERGPTLRPSIGNWQLPCKSHYLITNGHVTWSTQWTNAQINYGRKKEDQQRKMYFERINSTQEPIMESIWNKIKRFFG